MPHVLASDLFAEATGLRNGGHLPCHWCGAQCLPQWKHDDPGRQPHSKIYTPAKFPQSLYVCNGCRMFRRSSFTIRFLDESFRDRQTGGQHSWWMTTKGVWGVQKGSCAALLELLLSPPLRFCLALTDGTAPNYLQLMVVNDLAEVLADTPLRFTVNNVVFSYSVYELEDAVKLRITDGKEAGIRELMKFLGPCLPPKFVEEKRGRGERDDRPNAKEVLKKPVTMSGGRR